MILRKGIFVLGLLGFLFLNAYKNRPEAKAKAEAAAETIRTTTTTTTTTI